MTHPRHLARINSALFDIPHTFLSRVLMKDCSRFSSVLIAHQPGPDEEAPEGRPSKLALLDPSGFVNLRLPIHNLPDFAKIPSPLAFTQTSKGVISSGTSRDGKTRGGLSRAGEF
jgi:hypothetical protein